MKLGMIEEVPTARNAKIPPAEQYNDDPMFKNMIKESNSKFPARNLLGVGILPMSGPAIEFLKKQLPSKFEYPSFFIL